MVDASQDGSNSISQPCEHDSRLGAKLVSFIFAPMEVTRCGHERSIAWLHVADEHRRKQGRIEITASRVARGSAHGVSVAMGSCIEHGAECRGDLGIEVRSLSFLDLSADLVHRPGRAIGTGMRQRIADVNDGDDPGAQ